MSARFIGLLFLLRTAVESISVTSVSTLPGYTATTNSRGSFMGGSWIGFYGDFTNPGNHLVKSDPSLYKIKVGTGICSVNTLYCTSTFLNCTVPPAIPGANPAVLITMSYNNLQISIPVAFRTFTYSLYSTPYILNVNPIEACPGDSISFFGRWMTNYYSLIVGMSVNQTSMSYINNGTLNYWGWINATGTVRNNKHGDENAYVTLMAGYGISFGVSQTSWMGTQYEYSYYETNPLIPYNFRTLARIDSISNHEGSMAGGLTITINGAGFSTVASQYAIYIDQSSCTVATAAYNQVTCVTQPQSAESVLGPALGNAGLRREVWYSTLQFNQLEGIVPPAYTTIIANPMLPYDEGINIKSRLYGFFSPPVQAQYTFYVSSDGPVVVYLNQNSMVKSMTPSTLIINSTTVGLPMERFVFPSTISRSIQLTYPSYLEVQHVTAHALSHFSMGVLITPAFLNNLAPNILEITIYPTSIIREIQIVTISGLTYPTGGTLVFTYGGVSLSPIAWNSASKTWLASSCQNVFNSLNIGQMLCSLTTTPTSLIYTVTFNFPLYSPRSPISVLPATIIPNTMRVTVIKNKGTYGLFGNFTVQLGSGAITPPFAFGMNLAQLQLSLNMFYPQLQNQLLIQGTCNGDLIDYWFYVPYYIYNSPSLSIGNGKLFTIGTSYLYGGNLEDTLVTSTNILYQSNNRMSPNDGTYYNIIPSDFLSPYYTTPQLVMSINGVSALCRGDCSFMYKSTLSPIITDFKYFGNSLTITGDQFSNIELISFAYQQCVLLSNNQTFISCLCNQGVAGSYYPLVLITGKGFALISTQKLISIPLAISSVHPTVGSLSGGTQITINGIGFPLNINSVNPFTVKIGNSPCTISSSTVNRIICTTTGWTTNNILVVTVGTLTATNTDFQYSTTGSVTVLSITPSYASTIVNTPLTIVGQGFSYNAASISVTIGPYICMITAVTPTQINCDINGGAQGMYTLTVGTPYGYATFTPPTTSQFELKLEITSTSIRNGSIMGGGILIINGYGFSVKGDYMYILLGDQDSICEIDTVYNDTTLACIIPAAGNKNIGQDYPIMLFGRLEDMATCPNTCLFQWSGSATPYITSITPSAQIGFTAGQSATLCGGGLGTDITKIVISYAIALATVTSATGTCVTITVPYAIGSSLNLTLHVDGEGDGLVEVSNIKNNLFVNSISPTIISQGGADIVINGGGFYSGMAITFGTVPCSVINLTPTAVTCTAGGSTATAAQSLKIGGNTILSTLNAPLTVTYTYRIQVTSAAVNTGTGVAGYQIVIGITNLNTVVPKLPKVTSASVMLGNYPCTLIGLPTGANANCVPTGPPGTYLIRLSLGNIGYATSSISYKIPLSIGGIFAASSSYGGGVMLTISGSGLGPGTTFTICGLSAQILSTQGSIAHINSPLMPTTYSLNQYNIVTASSLVTHYTIISNIAVGSANAFDGNANSWYTGNNPPQTFMFIGVDVGVGFKFNLNSFKFLGGMACGQYYASLAGTILQASNDGINWVNLFTFYVVSNWWNQWTVPLSDNVSYRFFRLYQPNRASNYAINEIAITGILFLDYNLPDLTCPVTATFNGATSTSSTLLTYTSNYTTVIDSINPRYGTKAGGTIVTFTGAGFQNDPNLVNVLIDNINCTILNVTATTISCMTAPQNNCIKNSLSIYFVSRGYASTRGLTFMYADNWSSATTWGGEVPPRAGESVDIPPCTTVILDTITPLLNLILIEGSLIFLDEGEYGYVSLDANYIFISTGLMQVGTETNPYTGYTDITIHGDVHSPALPIYGNSFLIVRYGTLDLHGSPKLPT